MNEKQAKLLRYFVKNTGQLKLATAFRIGFDTLNHKKKGKLTRWIKEATVTAMAMREQQKKAQAQANLDTLKGFTV